MVLVYAPISGSLKLTDLAIVFPENNNNTMFYVKKK